MKSKIALFSSLIVIMIFFVASIAQGLFLPTTVTFSSVNKEEIICTEIRHLRQYDQKCLKGKKIKLFIKKTYSEPLYLKVIINKQIVFDDSIEYLGRWEPLNCIVSYSSIGKIAKKCNKANIFNTYFES